MHPVMEIAISALILLGAFFILVGSIGIIKLPTLMSRLHAPSKATTLGVGGCLIASMLNGYSTKGTISIQEVLITFFLFITAPVTAHFLAKAYIHRDKESAERLPKPADGLGWSTFQPVPPTAQPSSLESDRTLPT